MQSDALRERRRSEMLGNCLPFVLPGCCKSLWLQEEAWAASAARPTQADPSSGWGVVPGLVFSLL